MAVPKDAQTITSQQLADRWGMKEGSLRMMRMQGRGPRWITLGKTGRGKRPRVRYRLVDVERYEQAHGRPA